MASVQHALLASVSGPRNILLTVLACIFGYAFLSYVRLYLRLRQFPGPWLASISPIWLAYQSCNGRKAVAIQQMIQRYGSLARINIDQLVTDDPELFKLMNGTNSSFSRGRWYDAVKLEPDRDHVFSARDKALHASLKSKLNPGYSGKDGVDIEAAVDPVVGDLINLIKEHSDSQVTFDFAPLSGYFTLDSIAKIAFGKDIGYLRKNDDIFNYFRLSAQFVLVLEMSTDHPWILAMLNFAMRFLRPTPRDEVGMGALMGVAYQAIDEKFDEKSENKSSNTILSSWIRKGLTREECQNETMISFLAGTDSTAQVLRSCFMNIVASPIVYGRLSNEIKTAVDAGRISSPVIKNVEANTMPYLQACIKEGLRIMQPLNGLQSKRAPPEGLDWKGFHIPGNTEVGVSQYTMLRRKDIFGHDADIYRPERWLEASSPAQLQNMQNVLGMAFGGGSGLCLGKNIALLELNKAIFELFRTFDFQLTNPLAEIKTRVSGTVIQKDINVKAYPKSFS